MDENQRYGATPEDWMHFDLVLGLTEDLLPVVSNPIAKISAKSSLKTLGKTPSLYNKTGGAVGISAWTEEQSTSAEVDSWSKVPDYGVCVQTRRVRALDIDVNDSNLADKIEIFIYGQAGVLPKRYRVNSGKRLFAFIVDGDLSKRILPVEGGMIEFLASGQQFIASGQHVSGARYEWAGGLPLELPMLSMEEFETLWDALVKGFATGEVRSTREAKAKGDSNALLAEGGLAVGAGMIDDILPYLKILSTGKNGAAYIKCPFENEHTSDSGETQCAYFPKGTRGYGSGHFHCLHAHCVGRDDVEFIEALGVVAAGFDVVETPKLNGSITLTSNAPQGLHRNKVGAITATLSNLEIALNHPGYIGEYIKFDEFKDEIMFTPINEPSGWRQLIDTDYTRLRILLENKGFLPIGRDMIRDIVHRVAKENKFDSAIEWLSGLKWDGRERVKTFLEGYMAADGESYNRAVSEYIWAALAGRVLSPGCKADAAPIFIGEQYIGKSHAVASMVPDQKFFTEIRFDENEDNLSRKMRGKLIAEFAELRGLHSREMEGVKAFISRQYEEWVPKYMEFSTTFPRRLLFIGTSNKDEIFADETGNRRWFPVKVKKADITRLENDREMLWAEGAKMFKENGIQNYYENANYLATGIRDEFMISDVWERDINEWLDKKDIDGVTPRSCEFLQIADIMKDVFGINSKDMKKFDELRIGKILRKFGYEKHVRRINGQNTKVWIATLPYATPMLPG